MGRRVLGAVVTAMCLCSGTASGQVALGAAQTPGVTIHRPDSPKPEPPPVPHRPDPPYHSRGDRGVVSPPNGGDLFLAGPDTYAPYNPRRASRVHPYRTFSGYFPTPYVPDFPAREIVTVVIVSEPEPTHTSETARTLQPEAATNAPPVVTPAVPKTFYVIPRCYAGDRRPSADWLPAGCDIRKLRIIAPGAP
jgi:hypothetical protein